MKKHQTAVLITSSSNLKPIEVQYQERDIFGKESYLKISVIFQMAWICPNITYIFSEGKVLFCLIVVQGTCQCNLPQQIRHIPVK